MSVWSQQYGWPEQQPITSFAELQRKALDTPPLAIAIAGADDAEVLISADQARRAGLINGALLVGERRRIEQRLQSLGIERGRWQIEQPDNHADSSAIAALAVAAVRRNAAQILVKGAIDSASYFRAILHRETGLRRSELLSNLTLFELPGYPKLLGVTDNAILLEPNLRQKKALIENSRDLFSALQIAPVKVAVVAAVEKETLSMVATTDGAWLRKMNQKGQMAGFIVDGPFGYDACICRESALKKGLGDSVVAGDPDLLLMPNLEAANILGKAYKYHAQADSGGLVLGASAPVVLNSRSDSARRRFNSLLLAKVMAAQGRTDPAARDGPVDASL